METRPECPGAKHYHCHQANYQNLYFEPKPYLIMHPPVYQMDEQPIDLTKTQPDMKQYFRQPAPKKHRQPRKIASVASIQLQATESKQTEILKAAKSLFSKRTRTLYHWMYPNTPKQQIKTAVANLWQNLNHHEKQFYISQVLVKFGFSQRNLMVNPQIGGIKELPPLPDTFESNFAAKELQTAISSISTSCMDSEVKKRQGRPPGSKNKKVKGDFKVDKEFQDDPELSKELEKFAISFDCFK